MYYYLEHNKTLKHRFLRSGEKTATKNDLTNQEMQNNFSYVISASFNSMVNTLNKIEAVI